MNFPLCYSKSIMEKIEKEKIPKVQGLCRTESEDRKGKGKDLQVSEHLGLLLIKWGTLSAPR